MYTIQLIIEGGTTLREFGCPFRWYIGNMAVYVNDIRYWDKERLRRVGYIQ